jgi:mRNA-degrading endonuclease RelE of RelBE toxin-antitoxin system
MGEGREYSSSAGASSRIAIMSYELFTTPSGQRSLRKLPRNVREYLFEELQVLKTDPLTGEQLKGALRSLRSFHTKLNNTHYRVAYEVKSKDQSIVVWYAATRETFYAELQRLNLKRSA